VLIDSAELSLRGLPAITAVDCRLERGAARERFTPPFEIFQASSGGAHWNSRTHVDRHGQARLPFRGYRGRSAVDARVGVRALPIVVARTAEPPLAVTLPQFWQEFPRSRSVDATSVEMGLWPAEAGPHELQGGEQKTHRLVLAF